VDLGVLRGPFVKTVLVMALAAGFGALGDMLLSKGMKEVGDVSLRLGALPQVLRQVTGSPAIIGGVGFLILFFVLWLAVLSWADLSVALPLTALSYVFGAFLAKYYLGEQLCVSRWLGTALICLGVMLVTRSIK
jgi:drug/metabolite transporter (DMT)-like permease